MRVTIDLDEDIYQAASTKASQHQIPIEQAISELLRLSLTESKTRPGKKRFTFSLPGGPVTAEDVRQCLEDDEVDDPAAPVITRIR